MKLNWKLLFLLSLVGIPLGVVQLFNAWGGPFIELGVVLALSEACAVIVVKKTARLYFLSGFMLALMTGLWQNIIYVAFFSTESANHALYIQSLADWGPDARVSIFLYGVVTDVVQGIVLGVLFFITGKVMKSSGVHHAEAFETTE